MPLFRRIAVLGLLVFGALALGAPRAWAHAVLLETSPVDGAVIASTPAQVSLRFDEAVTPIPRSIQLLDAGGHPIDIGRPQHPSGKADTIASTLPPGLRNGTYVVSWRVVSADSHVVSGAFQFSVGAPSPEVAAVGHGPSSVAPDVKTAGDVLAYLGFTVATGGTVFLGIVWAAGEAPRRVRRIVDAGLLVLFVGTILAFLMQYPYATGGGVGSAFSGDAVHSTWASTLGKALLARLVVSVVLAVAIRARARWLGAAGLLALPLTWTLTDHSRVGFQVGLAVPIASLHLLAVAVWLGGLIPLAACVLGRVPGTEVALPRFSRLALPCFTVIVLTGLYQTWRQVGTWLALPDTAFGRLLLIKLGGVLLILALASRARRFVQHKLPATGWPWLRRSLAVEGMLGVAVLAVATVMVNTAPARSSYTPPVHARLALPRTGALAGGHVEVRLTPAKQGLNVADIYVVARDGTLVAVPDVSAQLAPTRKGLSAEAITVAPAEPGHYVASTVSIPSAGTWQLQLYVRTGEFDEAPLLLRFRAH